jgi:hypothetical protein
MLDVWRRWSEQSEKYQEGDCDEKWPTFGNREPGVDPATGRLRTLGVGTLFKWAKEATGWRDGPKVTTGGHAKADPPKASSAADGPAAAVGWEIIRDYFARRFGDGYRTGDAVYCNRERREVRRQEACAALPPDLIEPLSQATNVPRMRAKAGQTGEFNEDALPGFFKKWAGTAWSALLQTLPDEDGAEPGRVDVAKDEFRRLVRQALLSEFTLSWKVKDPYTREVETRIEQRSAVGWCQVFARSRAVGGWGSVRSNKLWFRWADVGGGEVRLRIAFRHELLSQLRADRRLIEIGSNAFTRRAKRYGVGEPGGQSDRPGGQWALVLNDDFLDDLIATFPDPESCTVPESATDAADGVQDPDDKESPQPAELERDTES